MMRGVFLVTILVLGTIPAFAKTTALSHDTRFCPTWAEAHERTLASLKNGRPPYPVKWKGCLLLKQNTTVEVIDTRDGWTEIIYKGKHWFADE